MKALRRSMTSSSSNSSSPPQSSSPSSSSWIHLRSVLFVVSSSSPANCSSSSSDRGRLKSPWSRRKRKRALSAQQWKSLFTPDGKLRDGGVKLLKKVRSGGVDPNIRAEVWPFLLGVYDLNSTQEERDISRTRKRKEYEKLRRQCQHLLKSRDERFSDCLIEDVDSPCSEDVVSARESLSSEEGRSPDIEFLDGLSSLLLDDHDAEGSRSVLETESSDSDSSEDPVLIQEDDADDSGTPSSSSSSKTDTRSKQCTTEDFATWQRIIRLDALRANPEGIPFSPSSASGVSDARACRAAEAVGLKDYDHLDPCVILHAARLVAILEAYALHDLETGYCQGMSDLLSPIITVVASDHEAFWCFVGFMKKARDNFRLDEAGIRRQLSTVSKIIRYKDAHLYRHLQKLQAEDCFFVYRMVVVLFRRELTFEQTTCLWEVMWADQAAIRAGIGKAAWRSRIRLKAPPTDDLLLYAISALVLQRRKLIIEKYSSMDEILRECNDMSGQQLDVWKLLDDAHNLVVNLHDKIQTETETPLSMNQSN